MRAAAPSIRQRRAAPACINAPVCPSDLDRVVALYLTAQEFIVERGFGSEIDLQDAATLDSVSESSFLREAAWVVLSAGMSERAVRSRFSDVAESFMDFESAHSIVRYRCQCVRRALLAFNYPRKIEAIAAIASTVATHGFAQIRIMLSTEGVQFLQTLDFIGPVTSFHLAKNLGVDVVKPDRHLVRIAQSAGFSDPHSLCAAIAWRTGDRLATIDLVLWRFATLVSDYGKMFHLSSRHPNDQARQALPS